MVHPYLRRRSGEEAVSYPSKEVEAVLKRTLGVPIFQEQVMQLAIVAAGFSPGEADGLRRAMAAWKRKGGLEPFQRQLIDGMRERGYAESFAQQIFNQILGFGEYGFPECVVGETRIVDADTGRWVAIEDLAQGRAHIDRTLACDAELLLRPRKVLRVISSGVKPVWRLRTALGHEICATAEHPFMTLPGWRPLGDLKVGDHVATAHSLPISGDKIYWDRIVQIEPVGDRATYDLKIEGDHNFLANHFVVHNSHAASFALLVYTSAWLKAHEPAAFCAALINSQPMGFYAPAQLVRDARSHGVEVRPADATVSEWDCTLERRDDGRPALRLGLRLVKHLSQEGARRLLAARMAHPFENLEDLAGRAALDRRDLEALAAGDALGASQRASLPRRVAGERGGTAVAPAAGGYAGPGGHPAAARAARGP